MKSGSTFFRPSRAALAFFALLFLCFRAQAQTDPLPSWSDGPAKRAIVDLVKATTDRASPNFVPPEARIATFDQDGTTWVEHPIYTQIVYCLGRVPALVKAKPKLINVEPFKTVLSGNREAIAKLPTKELLKILAATLSGMTVDEFKAEVTKWITAAKHPRWDRLYTELTYQPMLEAMRYLRENGYKTYIVTGGGEDFVRIYANRIHGIPPEQIVGTAGSGRSSHSATQSAIGRCWNTSRPAAAPGWRCLCCTTMWRANMPMDRLKDSRIRRSVRLPRRCTTKRRRTVG
jgi:haloacid dehalogenase-like hydrolase